MRASRLARARGVADQDADCGEALWALDQPPHSLDFVAMVRDTTGTLTRLPHTRPQIRDALPPRPATTPRGSSREAYSGIPGRDPQNR